MHKHPLTHPPFYTHPLNHSLNTHTCLRCLIISSGGTEHIPYSIRTLTSYYVCVNMCVRECVCMCAYMYYVLRSSVIDLNLKLVKWTKTLYSRLEAAVEYNYFGIYTYSLYCKMHRPYTCYCIYTNTMIGIEHRNTHSVRRELNFI